MGNLDLWNRLKQPPPTALKQIAAGRMKGKTDISPQWRYQALTEEFGPCGIGWKYDVNRVWNEPGSDGQVFAFAEISLFVKHEDGWSEGIPGYGGNMLVTKEKAGLHSSDEGYKMAITDALSVACKMLGVAADIYAGAWDGVQYREEPTYINLDQQTALTDLIKETDTDLAQFLKVAKATAVDKILIDSYSFLEGALIKKKDQMSDLGE
jgi:hypothetical protein